MYMRITREEFLKSYAFYLNHPDISKVLYDSMFGAGFEEDAMKLYKSKTKTDSLNKQFKNGFL